MASSASSNQRLSAAVGTRRLHISRNSNAAPIIWSRPLPVLALTAMSGTPRTCARPSFNAARMPLKSALASSATSHLLMAIISARPSSSTILAILRSCASSPRVASSSSTTTSAKSTARRASATDSRSSLSTTCAFLRMPAVSISRISRLSPSRGSVQSQSIAMESRVMPASGPVSRRSSPSRRLISVDLPAFGRPTIANFSGPASRASSSSSLISASISFASDFAPMIGQSRSNRSAMPSPCSALIPAGSPKPREKLS